MLILVGVTINFVINGGIIGKAKTASSDMQKSADREELQLAIIASKDYITDDINEAELKANLPSWTITKNQDGSFTCTSKSENSYSVSKTGEINVENNSQEEAVFQIPGVYAGQVTNENNETNTVAFFINKNGYVHTGEFTKDNIFFEPGTTFLGNLMMELKIIDNFEVKFENGETTYDKALVMTGKEMDNKTILGYINNNQIIVVKPEFEETETNVDENSNVIEYKKINDVATLSLVHPATIEDIDYEIYESSKENDELKILVALNKSHTDTYGGVRYNSEAVPEENLKIPTDYFDDDIIWLANSPCFTVDTYEVNMSDGTTKTYNNVIFTTYDYGLNNEIIEGVYKPIGFFDQNNNFVGIDYTTEDHNYTGYPSEYTKWEEVAYTKK